MSDVNAELVTAMVGRVQAVEIGADAAAQIARQLDGVNRIVRGVVDGLLPFDSEPAGFLKAQEAAKRSAER